MRNHSKISPYLIAISLVLAGCEGETGTVDLEASKAAAQQQLQAEAAQGERPKAPIRDATARPKVAPPRATQR